MGEVDDGQPIQYTAHRADLGSAAFAFALKLRTIATMPELAALFMGAIEPVGMTAGASGLVSGPNVGSQPAHFASWSQDWLAYYLDHQFLLIDPAVRWARNSGAPISWSDLVNLLAPRDPGRKVVEAGRGFGFTDGMVVPTRSSDNAVGLVCVAGPRPPLDLEEQVFLTVVSRAAFQAAEAIAHDSYIGRPAPIFSGRELECLALLVRGHSYRHIGKMLGLSEPTVRFHLGNARDKLGATSRSHLAALVVSQGYVAL